MTIQLDTTLRNGQLDLIESSAGAAALLQIFTGAQPANCAAADSGTKLAEIVLPSDWMAAASGGSKAKSGTWSVAAIADGTAAHFRLKNAGDTVCYMQGTVATSGGDATIDNASIATGQTVTVSTFTITAGNA